jgi:hypothetical protein
MTLVRGAVSIARPLVWSLIAVTLIMIGLPAVLNAAT